MKLAIKTHPNTGRLELIDAATGIPIEGVHDIVASCPAGAPTVAAMTVELGARGAVADTHQMLPVAVDDAQDLIRLIEHTPGYDPSRLSASIQMRSGKRQLVLVIPEAEQERGQNDDEEDRE